VSRDEVGRSFCLLQNASEEISQTRRYSHQKGTEMLLTLTFNTSSVGICNQNKVQVESV